MPGIQGYNVLKYIREKKIKTKVAVVTARPFQRKLYKRRRPLRVFKKKRGFKKRRSFYKQTFRRRNAYKMP